MNTLADIDAFISQKNIAIAGVSRNPQKFGNAAYKELKKMGYNVFPVNPSMEKLGEDQCYPNLGAIPAEVQAVLIATPRAETEKVLKEGISMGIRNYWVQQGAESPATLELVRTSGMNIIHKKCILMFAGEVGSIHKFHRFIVKLFGRYPR